MTTAKRVWWFWQDEEMGLETFLDVAAFFTWMVSHMVLFCLAAITTVGILVAVAFGVMRVLT